MAEPMKISFGQDAAPEAGYEEHQQSEMSELGQLKQLISSGDTQSALALVDKLMAGEKQESAMQGKEESSEGPNAKLNSGLDKVLGN